MVDSYKAPNLGLDSEVFRIIRMRPDGLSRAEIQSRLGINLHNEEDRQKVWKLSASLTRLQHEDYVVSSMVQGVRYYFPRSA